VVAYSDYVARFFANFLKNKKTVHVLGNGVSFSPWNSDEEPSHVRFPDTPLTLAYCGTLASHKGPHVILEALKIAALPKVNLLLIGHSPRQAYASQLRAAAAEIPGLKMRMYGPYEPKDLCFLLRDVDCVVVPSLVPEAGPVVPREALAEGVPIIAARRGALPELVTEGQNGCTFDPRRPGELAAILRRLATDPEVLPRLQVGARSTINMTVAQHASRVRRIYAEAIDQFDGNHQAWMADASEVNFAHESLVNLGCDKTIKSKGS
jgi:glycosyltransferase involved in cell wall biosynthesis